MLFSGEYERGRADERAAVIAKLKRKVAEYQQDIDGRPSYECETSWDFRDAYEEAVELIESGEHLVDMEQNNGIV